MKNSDDKPMPQEWRPFTVGSFCPEDADGIGATVDILRERYKDLFPV